MLSGNENIKIVSCIKGTIKPALIKMLDVMLMQLVARGIGVFKGVD